MTTKSTILNGNLLSMTTTSNNQSNVMIRSVNDLAPVKCSKSIFIQAHPEKVWAMLTNINEWDKWQSDISHSKLDGSLQANSTFNWKTGGVKIHSIIHTAQHNKAFGWTGKTFGMFAIHNWNLQEENGGTRVSVNESMEGFLASLLKNYFNKNLETGMIKWLELLKIEAEK